MGRSIEDILGKVKPPVRSTWVCLDGELWSQHDELSKQLDAVRADSPTGKMGDATGVGELGAELRRVEQQMRDAEQEFKFRGISSYKRDEIIAKYPGKNGQWDTTAGAHEFLAAAAVEPAMTVDQARQLVEAVNHGALSKLFNCAWSATEGSADVPFSGRAFASIPGSGSS